MTPAALQTKWLLRFADNDTFEIDEADLREFVTDLRNTFTDGPGAVAAVLASLGRGLKGPFASGNATGVKTGEWWLATDGIWEARRDMTANASPVPGANWSMLVSFSTYSDQQARDAIAASNTYLTRYSRCLVVDSAGNITPYTSLTAALFYATNCTVYVYGSHDLGATTAIGLATGCVLYMTPGSRLRCREIYFSQNGGDSTILGPGTVEAILSQGPGSRVAYVRGIKLIGRINPYAFNSTAPLKRFLVEECDIDSGADYVLLGQTGFGGNYQSPVSVEFYRCRVTTIRDTVFRLYDSDVVSNGKPIPADAGNFLHLVGNLITAPAGAVVVDTTAGPFTLQNSHNTYFGPAPLPGEDAGSGGASSTLLVLDSTDGLRVSKGIPVAERFQIAAETLDTNASGVRYQLDTNTRTQRVYGPPDQTLVQINAQLAALTAQQMAEGAKLYAKTLPTAAANPSTVLLKLQ